MTTTKSGPKNLKKEALIFLVMAHLIEERCPSLIKVEKNTPHIV